MPLPWRKPTKQPFNCYSEKSEVGSRKLERASQPMGNFPLPTSHFPLHPEVSRVLIIGPSNIGDAILSSDVISSMRSQYPDAHLTLVVGERAQTLFAGDPRIQTLVNTDAFGSLMGRLRLALSLWRYQ